MRNWPFALLLLLPTAARGQFAVVVGSDTFNRPTIQLEVFLYPDSPEDDRLNRFQVKLDLEDGRPDGLHFSGAVQSTRRPPLFPGVPLQDLGSDADTLFIGASLPPGQGADVTLFRDGLFTAIVEVPAGFVPDRGSYLIRVDPAGTVVYDVDGRVVPTGAGAGIIIVPEPAGAMTGLTMLGGLALRRRR